MERSGQTAKSSGEGGGIENGGIKRLGEGQNNQ